MADLTFNLPKYVGRFREAQDQVEAHADEIDIPNQVLWDRDDAGVTLAAYLVYLLDNGYVLIKLEGN